MMKAFKSIKKLKVLFDLDIDISEMTSIAHRRLNPALSGIKFPRSEPLM